MEESSDQEIESPQVSTPQKDSNRTKNSGETDFFKLFKSPANFQPKSKSKKTPKRKFSEEVDTVKQSEKLRPRTPSGQVLSVSVGEIASKIENRSKHDTGKINLDYKASRNQPTETLMRTLFEHVDCPPNSDTWCEAINTIGMCEQVSNQRTSDLREKMKTPGHQSEEMSEDTSHCVTKHQMEVDVNKNETGHEREPFDAKNLIAEMVQEFAPSTDVDVEKVTKMMASMVAGVVAAVRAETKNEPDRNLNEVRLKCESLEAKVALCQVREKAMIDAMAGLAGKINELQQKTEYHDLNTVKKMVIFSGFEASLKKKVCRKQLETFFQQEIGITPCIEDIFWIGQNNPKDVVLTFLSANDKRLVFQNIDKIKSYKNSQGYSFSMRDYKTPKQNEFNRKCQSIADRMQEEDTLDREEIAVEQGRIMIGERAYEQKVTVPDPVQVLRNPLFRLNMIMAKKVDRGPTYEEKGNTFTGYTACVDSPEQVQEAYMKIKVNHSDARHVICAYYLPGTEKLEMIDCCDDEDYGAARPVLDFMVRHKVSHRVVFIVRQVGEKLNEKRNEMYLKTAQATLHAFSYNELLKVNQEVKDREDTRSYETPRRGRGSVRRGPKRNQRAGVDRGRGQGRGGSSLQGARSSTQNLYGQKGWQRSNVGNDSTKQTYIPMSEMDSNNRTGQYKFATPWEAGKARRSSDEVD